MCTAVRTTGLRRLTEGEGVWYIGRSALCVFVWRERNRFVSLIIFLSIV